MNTLITSTKVISDPFEISNQITVYAFGLEPDDVIEFYILSITRPEINPCACPPGNVVLPAIDDELQLKCCGVPITLSRDNPYVIMDTPQGAKLRAKLVAPAAPSTQLVIYKETNTQNVNDRLRGCPCAGGV